MDPRSDQRQEEYCQHLRIDALLHFFPGHAHFHQDIETILILVSLRDLLVVHDQHCTEKEYRAEKYAQEEKSAVDRDVVRPSARLGVDIIMWIVHTILLTDQFSDPLQDRVIDFRLFLIITGQIKAVTFFDVGDYQTVILFRKRVYVLLDLLYH